MAEIHQLKYKLKVSVIGKITLYKSCPALFFALADLGIAVAGEIGKVNAVYTLKVYSYRFTGHRAYSCKGFSVKYLIYKRGFSYV